MPPKLLNTYLTGQQNETVSTPPWVDSPRAMVYLEPPPADQDINEESSCSSTAHSARDVLRNVAMVPLIPRVTKGNGSTFQILQVWEGTVIEILDDVFVASLSDKTKPSNPDERVEFAYSELKEDDKRLVSPGSVFYWTVGREITPAGQLWSRSNVELAIPPIGHEVP